MVDDIRLKDIQDELESYPERLIRSREDKELHMRKRVPVGILGATGAVGQKLISLLSNHPWFEIAAITASEKSVGKTYKEACEWRQPTPIPPNVAKMTLLSCEPNLPCKIVFSAVDGSISKEIERRFAENAYAVVSCARGNRMEPDVPMLIPEVNMDLLKLTDMQGFPKGGLIVAKPNCSATGLAIALKPLILEFGVEEVIVSTLQSLSGAGYPGVPSSSIVDNVIPFIADEEERLELEPKKIFGELTEKGIKESPIKISATCTRVPVSDGHLELVSVKLKDKPKAADVIRAFREFNPPVQELNLPSRAIDVIHYFDENDYPQPRLHRDLEGGMATSIGRLRHCPILDYKFVVLTHNTMKGAASGAILIAELLVKQGKIFW